MTRIQLVRTAASYLVIPSHPTRLSSLHPAPETCRSGHRAGPGIGPRGGDRPNGAQPDHAGSGPHRPAGPSCCAHRPDRPAHKIGRARDVSTVTVPSRMTPTATT